LEPVSHSASDLLAQSPAQVQVAQVTAVRLNPTLNGVEVILETAGEFPEVLTSSAENSLITDIPNAQLRLTGGREFRWDNPTKDIASVEVTNLDAKTIRVMVTGKVGVPTAEVSQSPQALILSVAAPPAPAPQPTPAPTVPPAPAPTPTEPPSVAPEPEAQTEEPLELTVTAEQEAEGYRVPNASTATGTDTPILETPFSVQVVPQEVIRDQQATEIQEVLSNVSGVTYLGSDAGREAIFNIRGFGNAFSANVPVLRDGYRLYGDFQAIPELANLEQVEVLKGPASILYGQIEPGGIINLVSKKPLAEPFYEAELQVGSRELVRPRIDFTGPLTPDGDLLYRLNALYKHEQSFRDYTTDTDRFSVAPVLTWKIGDRTDLTIPLEYIHNHGPADFGISKFGNGVAPIPRERVINNPDDTITTDYLSIGYNLEHRFSDNWKVRNSFRYIGYDYNYSVVALPFIVEDETVTRFYAVQEAQARSYSLYTNAVGNFTTGSVKHTLTAGIDLNRSESSTVSLFDAANPSPINIFDPDYDLVPKPSRSALPLFNDTVDTSNRLGIYLQDQAYLLDNLILVAGLRYDTVSQKTTNVETPFTPGGETEQTNDAVTPRVGLLYQPVEELALFGNYSQSFNPNTAATASGQPLEPERGEGFEVGVKTELLDQKLLATLTYFNITKSSVAVTDPDFPLFSIAVGEQKSQGAELDIVGELSPGWKVIGSYSYIDAKVTDDIDPTIIGNRLFGVPRHTASLWTTYEIQQGSLQGLGFGVGVNYAGNRFGDLANSFEIGDYLTGNAAIFYRRDGYRFALNFKNITNANYIRAVTGNEGGVYPGEPLTVIGSFSAEF
jgi:iron complex outermembrane receptor protein